MQRSPSDKSQSSSENPKPDSKSMSTPKRKPVVGVMEAVDVDSGLETIPKLNQSTPQLTLLQLVELKTKGAMEGIEEAIEEIQKKKKEENDMDMLLLESSVASYNTEGNVSRAELKLIRHVIWGLFEQIEYQKINHEQKITELGGKVEQLTQMMIEMSKQHEEMAEKVETITGQAIFQAERDQSSSSSSGCFFCRSPLHSGQYCKEYANSVERRELLESQSRCFACFSIHSIGECQSKLKKCIKCKDGTIHRPSVCHSHSGPEGMEELRRRDKDLRASKDKEKEKRDEEGSDRKRQGSGEEEIMSKKPKRG